MKRRRIESSNGARSRYHRGGGDELKSLFEFVSNPDRIVARIPVIFRPSFDIRIAL
jgi:hypothetical protein